MAAGRPSLAQDLVWRIEAFGFDLMTAAARLFPIDAVSDFGAWLGRRLGPLTGAHAVAERNLRIAFPQASDAEIARLLDEQWAHAGRYFLEFPMMDRIAADPERIEVVNGERLARIARGREPVVVICAHLSNFETVAAAIVQSGMACQITYRAANNPYVDARIKKTRFKYGVRLFAPKGGDGARELLAALERGESVALLNDQKFNGGVAAPLFGVTAHTAPGPTRLALRFGTCLQPITAQRKDKAFFRVVVHPPIFLEATGDRTADIEAGVRRVNAWVEAQVRERPAEWWWIHKRWPNDQYRRRRR